METLPTPALTHQSALAVLQSSYVPFSGLSSCCSLFEMRFTLPNLWSSNRRVIAFAVTRTRPRSESGYGLQSFQRYDSFRARPAGNHFILATLCYCPGVGVFFFAWFVCYECRHRSGRGFYPRADGGRGSDIGDDSGNWIKIEDDRFLSTHFSFGFRAATAAGCGAATGLCWAADC